MTTYEKRTHIMKVRLDHIGKVKFKIPVHVDVERVFDPASSRRWYHLWSDDLCVGGTGHTVSEAWDDLEDTIVEYHKAGDSMISDLIQSISMPPKPVQVSPLYCPGKNDMPKKNDMLKGKVLHATRTTSDSLD
jgi:hypothetical protein